MPRPQDILHRIRLLHASGASKTDIRTILKENGYKLPRISQLMKSLEQHILSEEPEDHGDNGVKLRRRRKVGVAKDIAPSRRKTVL